MSAPTDAPVVASEEQARVKPVHIWAVIGALFLALEVYVWIKWVSGPYFTEVPSGPDDPPMYMKVPLVANAVLVWVGLPVGIWFIVIRPWLRERRITLDAMLFAGTGLMFFQDPLLNYFNTWCTYNTWLFNRGAWTSEIPGWVSPEEPGLQVPEPILTNAPGYAIGVLMLTIAGCAIMRLIKRRWPGITNMRLILVTYAIAFVFDFVMEALVLLPTGLYTYPGAIRELSFNAGTYYQWPIYEGFLWGGVQTALCCLRYFTDDRGRTVVERGLDRVKAGFAQTQLARFLAITGACSMCFLVFYNVPVQWFGMHADPWPKDHTDRSYFTGGICGQDSRAGDVPCPDPKLPIPTKRSGYVNTDGQLVMPK
ncbi:MAG TPA: spirocyclase AveC family protein [Nocardioides sp.]|nr:spirocyclase AveC family protein [Nocardioides sp.]